MRKTTRVSSLVLSACLFGAVMVRPNDGGRLGGSETVPDTTWRARLQAAAELLPVRLHAVYRDAEGDNTAGCYQSTVDLAYVRAGNNGSAATVELKFATKT